jgi:hypothetical protein
MQIFFSQGIAVLFSQAPDLGSLRHLLERQGYTITADEDTTEWPAMQGACLTLATDFESGAVCWVDICEFPWPDDMGTTGEPTLVTSAHALGSFGPFVHPGAFERALQAPGYQEAAPTAQAHQAFVRLRISHFFPAPEGSEESRPARPENAQPTQELGFLLRAAASLVELPTAIAYFNPNSELMLPLAGLGDILNNALEHQTYPIEAVCRIRGCPVEESWSFVDSIGLEQLGLIDHEFAWDDVAVTRSEQIHFLIDLMHYQADNAVLIESGHTTDGAHGQLWRAEEREKACMMPPRKVLHWTVDGAAPEPDLLAATSSNAPVAADDYSSLSPEAEDVLSKLEAWLPLRDSIRARAVNWLRSPAFRTVYYDDAHVPLALKVALEKEVSKKEAKETWQKIQFLGQQTPQLWNQYQQLASQGQVWFAVPMMTNPKFDTDVHSMLPCGVIVATDQTSMEILAAGKYAMIAYELYSGGGDPVSRPGTARMMSDDSHRSFYREAFPLEETQGSHFTLLSVLMRNSWMSPDDVPFIPFLAMPGPQGAIIQIPWHIATGKPPPPGSMEPGRFADVAEVDRLADKMVAEHNSKKWGCWNIFSLIIRVIFLAGIIGGIGMALFDKSTKPDKKPQIRKKALPDGSLNQK